MLVVDVETSGVDAAVHSIVSIGAVDFLHSDNQFNEECRIWDGAAWQPEALAVNGRTPADLSLPSLRPLEAVARDFFLWAAKSGHPVMAGQNVSFDSSFLCATAARFRIRFPFGRRLVDLHSVAYAHLLGHGLLPPLRDGTSDLSLDAILALVGLPPEPKPHLAINGAKLEAEAFSRLVYGKNLLSDFAGFPVPSSVS